MSTNTQDLRNKLVAKAEAGAKSNSPAKTIYDLIESQKAQIARALPRHMTADRLARITLTTIRTNPLLMQCSPQSLLGAVMVCAQLGLEPGPLGHAYLVPYRNSKTGSYEAQLIIGYRGFIDLARRSGNIVSIVAREVCEGDVFEFEYGLEERLVHKPALSGRGKAYAYYAVAKYKDGGHTILVMSREDVEKHRMRSRAKDSGPWQTDYDEMAKKTVIRALSKYLPMSIEFARAVAQDESVHTEISEDMVDTTPVMEAEYTVTDDGTGAASAEPAAPAEGQSG